MSEGNGYLRWGGDIFFRTLRFSPDLALKLLILFEKIGPEKNRKMARVLKSAGKENHSFFAFAKRFSSEVSSLCRREFLRHNIWDENMRESNFSKVMIISVTSRCNFTCKDCFNNTYHKPKELETEALDRILFEAEESGTRIVALSGGEPLTKPDLLDIIERHKGIYFQIFTNGSLITEEIAKRIGELGNVLVLISLDGNVEDTDRRRGKGTYKRVFEAMERLQKHGVIFGSNVMVTPENFESTTSDKFVQNMIKAGGMMIWYITYRPVGEYPNLALIFTPEEHQRLFEKVKKIRNQYPIVSLENLYDMRFKGGCLATLGLAVHIDPEGNLTPCPPMHYSTENVLDGRNIGDIVRNSTLLNAIWGMHDGKHKGCVILERPEELKAILENLDAHDSTGGKDLETLEKYIGYKKNPSGQTVEVGETYDIYDEIKEVIKGETHRKGDGSACPRSTANAAGS